MLLSSHPVKDTINKKINITDLWNTECEYAFVRGMLIGQKHSEVGCFVLHTTIGSMLLVFGSDMCKQPFTEGGAGSFQASHTV